MSNRYVFSSHISYPFGENAYRTYCGKHTYERTYRLPDKNVCKVCYFDRMSEWEDIVMADAPDDLITEAVKEVIEEKGEEMLQDLQASKEVEPDKANIRKYGVSGEFDTETYRTLFNGYLKDPTILNISTEKSISEMNDEELTAWIYKLEEFVRTAKVAKQAARVTLEDRKLQMTEEQKKKQYELDKKYKPAAPTRKTPKAAKGTKAKLTEEQKRIKAAMDLMGMSEENAIAWLKSKGRI